MPWGFVTGGSLNDPEVMFHAITRSSAHEYRFPYTLECHSLCRPFILGVDFLLRRPLEMIFLVWGLLVLFRVFNPVSRLSLQVLFWDILFTLGGSLFYQFLYGSKGVDSKAYQTYLQKLKNMSARTEFAKRTLRAITDPQWLHEQEIFVTSHANHITYLWKIKAWQAIPYLMESLRQYFHASNGREHLYFQLLHCLYYLRIEYDHLYSKKENVAILKGFLQHWMHRPIAFSPEVIAKELQGLLKPSSSETSLKDFLKINPINSAAFLLLPYKEQEALIQYLMAGDVTCKSTLLSILVNLQDSDAKHVTQQIISDLNTGHEDMVVETQYPSSYQTDIAIIQYLCGSKEPAQIQIVNTLLEKFIEQRPEDQMVKDFFVGCIDACPDADIEQYLPPFRNILPMNNSEGLNAFCSWIADSIINLDRWIALLILALHPSEMFARHESSRFFQKGLYLFIDDVQYILHTLNRNTSLDDPANEGVKEYLNKFGLSSCSLRRLINETYITTSEKLDIRISN